MFRHSIYLKKYNNFEKLFSRPADRVKNTPILSPAEE